MEILQEILQHLGITCLIEDMVEPVVQLRHLLHMPLGRMKTGKIHILFQFFKLLRSNLLRSKPGAHPL